MTTNTYDESKIKTLSSLEHIRLRPGMYIGRLGNGSHPDDGIYILLKEIIDNAVDEFIMGVGKRVDIEIGDDNRVRVRDYGRGIPLGKVIDCVSVINTGAKYNTDVFQFSVGLNGVGTKAVNALSSEFMVRSHREGQFAEARFCRGKLITETSGETSDKDGTLIEFLPDPEQFKEGYSFCLDFIKRRLWRYAYLNAGLKLYFGDECFFSNNGLLDLLSKEISGSQLYDFIHYKEETLEFTFSHTDGYGENY